jgi:hypothetical protein
VWRPATEAAGLEELCIYDSRALAIRKARLSTDYPTTPASRQALAPVS